MQNINSYSEITPELLALSKLSKEHGQIDPVLYSKYEVKRGLRDLNGKGVLAGLTDISEITSYIIEDSDMIPCDGRLYYRGYKIQDLVAGFEKENRYGFEEIAYKLDENNQLKQKINWERFYGKLEKGTYRIVKPQWSNNEYIDLYSNEFEIK